MVEVSAGARRHFADLDREKMARQAAEARAEAAVVKVAEVEKRVGRLETLVSDGLHTPGSVLEALEKVIDRLDRIESRGVVKPELPKPTPLDGPLVDSRDANLLYGVKAIAAFLGVTPRQALGLIERGRTPHFHTGKIVCATKSGLAAWIAQEKGSQS